ncbi:MAG: lipopolysaccharide biosynthesis protein, partial [Mycobacteriales bacterium]
IYLALLVRILRENLLVDRRLRARVVVPAREVFGLGLPLVSTEVLNVVTNSMGFVALGVLAGTSGVADLRAVFPVAAMNQIVIYTFTTLFVPLVSRLHGQGDPGAVRTAYWQTAGWLAVLSFPVFALTGPFSHAVTVGLFGDRYAGSSAALALLSTGFYVNALFGFNAATLVVFGQVRRLMVLNLTCAALNAALYVLLIPWAGATGVAAAICVTVVVQNLLTQRGLCATIATPFLDPQFVPVLATVAATAGVAWAAAALLSPDLWEALVLSALGAVLVLWVNRRRLQLGQAFPELRRVPGVRRLVV